MPVPLWQPGTLYQPGDLVRPTSAGAVSSSVLDNPDFESGATGWTFLNGGLFSIGQLAADAFEGSWRMAAADNGGPQFATAENDARVTVTPGQNVTATCVLKCIATPSATRAGISISWYSSGMASLGKSLMAIDTTNVSGHTRIDPSNAGLIGLAANDFWTQVSVTGTAPANAAFFTVNGEFGWLPDGAWRADKFTVSFAGQAAPNPFLFRAVQAAAGFSGNSEPTWPTVVSNQVVDNEVTWEAVTSDNVVWEANRILVSGSTEPTFPQGDGAAVPDNTIAWVLDPRRVLDSNAPQSKIVTIAASKIFAADDDIVPFSATVNGLDWSAFEDAGYLPTGLQVHGATPVAAMGLYQSNLVIFNSEGFQMWQVDEDPQNMALLAAGPVGSIYHRAVQPVSNDLVFLTGQGIRNIGIAGASTNLQAGDFGKAVDSLVKSEIAALGADEDPIGLHYPGAGQYWLIFGSTAYVLTMNGGKGDMAWSTYTFPSDIDDWTLLGDDLYLRSGDKIWQVSDTTTLDDDDGVSSGVPFTGTVWWHYLDFGALGVTKQMIGFDLVATGEVDVSIGYNQKDSGQATTPYTISDGDTLPGDMIPIAVSAPSLQFRLDFAGDQKWEWNAASLYLQDFRSTS